jgi:thiol-disulfide isomerase/thioredoxin
LTKEIEGEPEKELKPYNNVFVLVYASWCPFSQRFLPIFENFAQDKTRTCMHIVADFKANLCDKLSVDVFPTVLVFEKGKLIRRLDGQAGQGLSEQQLKDFAKKT